MGGSEGSGGTDGLGTGTGRVGSVTGGVGTGTLDGSGCGRGTAVPPPDG